MTVDSYDEFDDLEFNTLGVIFIPVPPHEVERVNGFLADQLLQEFKNPNALYLTWCFHDLGIVLHDLPKSA